MIASVDGRISVAGRSAALGGPADRALFHALRARADAVVVAAGTVRSERYGPIIRDPDVRDRRERQGLRPQPLAVIVSRTLDLDPTLPLLADRSSHVVILTPATGDVPYCRGAGRLHPHRHAARRAGRAGRDLWRAPAALRGRPDPERVTGRRVADRRAVPLDLAAVGRRHARRRVVARRRRPALAAGAGAAHAARARQPALRALHGAAHVSCALGGAPSPPPRSTPSTRSSPPRAAWPISRLRTSSSSAASAPPSAATRGVALTVTTISAPSSSSSVTLGWRRIATVRACSIRRWSSAGAMPERRRTVSVTASGSRSGLTDTASTRLLGTSTGSSPALIVV